jgi:hypothetical protein
MKGLERRNKKTVMTKLRKLCLLGNLKVDVSFVASGTTKELTVTQRRQYKEEAIRSLETRTVMTNSMRFCHYRPQETRLLQEEDRRL